MIINIVPGAWRIRHPDHIFSGETVTVTCKQDVSCYFKMLVGTQPKYQYGMTPVK